MPPCQPALRAYLGLSIIGGGIVGHRECIFLMWWNSPLGASQQLLPVVLGVCVSLHLLQHLALDIFLRFPNLISAHGYFIVILICISPIPNEVEHLFRYLFVFWFLFCKCLLIFFYWVSFFHWFAEVICIF